METKNYNNKLWNHLPAHKAALDIALSRGIKASSEETYHRGFKEFALRIFLGFDFKN